MEQFIQDLRHAVRSLRRHPAFAVTAVLTLALGLGPTTAVSSLVYGLLLKPLPYERPDRLVQAQWLFKQGGSDALTGAQYEYWASHQHSFERAAAYTGEGAGFNLETAGQPEYVRGQRVSAGFFPVLGVQPLLGRGFSAEEDQPGGPPVVMVSWALWERRFAGAPDIVGRLIPLNGTNYAVVGVMPRAFQFGSPDIDLWLPLQFQVVPRDQGHNSNMIARLADSTSLAQAQSDMERILPMFRQDVPGHVNPDERGMLLKPYRDILVAPVRSTILLLFGGVVLVVIIAVANAAGLLLGRAASRRQEMAVRVAMGASRGALVRSMMGEGLVLGVAGWALGLAFARWTLDIVVRVGPRGLETLGPLSLDLPVLAGTAVLSGGLGAIAGLVPAWRASRQDVERTLREGARAGGQAGQRGRAALVVAEIAVSTVLLASAALLIVSLSKLWNVQPGFDAHGVTVVQLRLSSTRYSTSEAIAQFESRVAERLVSHPGVSVVSAASSIPLERGLNGGFATRRDGELVRSYGEQRIVGPGYFAALGIPVLLGRPIDDRDTRSSPRVAMVNRALAQALWPDASPIGKPLLFTNGEPYEVVGVVGDVLEQRLDGVAPRTLYAPQAQIPDGLATAVNNWFLASIIIKSRTPLNARVIRQAVAEVDPTQPIAGIRTMEEATARWLAPRRLVALLINIFAALAVLLAAVGLYGVIAFSVSRRKREIGLRVALGATQQDVLQLVLSQGFYLSLAGVGIGLAASLASTRLLRTVLFGVQATDARVLGAACVGLMIVALVATFVPARRASRLDPVVALRSE